MDCRKRKLNCPATVENDGEPVKQDQNSPCQLIFTENQRILDKISQLKGLSRKAFVSKYIEEKTYEEIAAELGKTHHQVRALCWKALGYIRYILEED